MEIVNECLLCNNSGQSKLVEAYDSSLSHFRLVKCTQCKLIFLSPRPDSNDISLYYPDDYLPYTKAIEEETSLFTRLSRRYDQYKRCSAVIREVSNKGKILDIGCSTGIFLQGMEARGWQTYGVEPSSYASQYARERFGLDVRTCYLEEAGFQDNFFDVVTLWDVLEHINQPQETLIEIRRILRPGGLIMANIPNPDSWESVWFGKYWLGWDIPRHLVIFSQDTLIKLFEKVDLDHVKTRSFTGRHNAMVVSLTAFLRNKKISKHFQQLLLTIVNAFPSKVITYPFFNLANWMNKSSFMVVYARKPEEN